MLFDSHGADHQLKWLDKNRPFHVKFQIILSSYEKYWHKAYPPSRLH